MFTITSLLSPGPPLAAPQGKGPGERATRRATILLLLLLFLAPACAPDKPVPEAATVRTKNLVLLTDTTQWAPAELSAYRDSLTAANYRVLISGFPGESLWELTARLPWLLQPGVDVFVYDPRLAGPGGEDSLRGYLAHKNLPVKVLTLRR